MTPSGSVGIRGRTLLDIVLERMQRGADGCEGMITPGMGAPAC